MRGHVRWPRLVAVLGAHRAQRSAVTFVRSSGGFFESSRGRLETQDRDAEKTILRLADAPLLRNTNRVWLTYRFRDAQATNKMSAPVPGHWCHLCVPSGKCGPPLANA